MNIVELKDKSVRMAFMLAKRALTLLSWDSFNKSFAGLCMLDGPLLVFFSFSDSYHNYLSFFSSKKKKKKIGSLFLNIQN